MELDERKKFYEFLEMNNFEYYIDTIGLNIFKTITIDRVDYKFTVTLENSVLKYSTLKQATASLKSSMMLKVFNQYWNNLSIPDEEENNG